MKLKDACAIVKRHNDLLKNAGGNRAAADAYADQIGRPVFHKACEMVLAMPLHASFYLREAPTNTGPAVAATILLAILVSVLLSSVLMSCGTFNVSVPNPAGQGTATGTATSQDTGRPAAAARAPKTTGTGLVWRNPDNGVSWQLVADSVTYGDAVCPASWSLPQTVIPAKFADYLLSHENALPAGGTYWTSLAGTIGHFARSIESNGMDIFDVSDASEHVLICTEGK